MVDVVTGRNDVDDAVRPIKPMLMYGWMLKDSARQLVSRSVLGDNEQVRAVAPIYGNRVNLIVLTRRRLIHWAPTVLNKVVDMAVTSITSVKLVGDDYGAHLKVNAGSDNLELGPVKRADVQRLLTVLREEIDRQSKSHECRSHLTEARATAKEDPAALISKLFDLHIAGALSKDEFEAKKKDILRRL